MSVRTAWAPLDSQEGEGGAGSADTDSNTTRNKVEQDILGFFLRLQKSNTLLNNTKRRPQRPPFQAARSRGPDRKLFGVEVDRNKGRRAR